MAGQDTTKATVSVGAAVYHAARILAAVGDEVKCLKTIIHRRIKEKLQQSGSDLKPRTFWGSD
jgi:hypothetical protein